MGRGARHNGRACRYGKKYFLRFFGRRYARAQMSGGASTKLQTINRVIHGGWCTVAGTAGPGACRGRDGCCPVRHNPQRSGAASGNSPSGSKGGRWSQTGPSSSASCWQSRQRQTPGTASSRDRGISSPQSMHRRRPLHRRSPNRPSRARMRAAHRLAWRPATPPSRRGRCPPRHRGRGAGRIRRTGRPGAAVPVPVCVAGNAGRRPWARPPGDDFPAGYTGPRPGAWQSHDGWRSLL